MILTGLSLGIVIGFGLGVGFASGIDAWFVRRYRYCPTCDHLLDQEATDG